MKKKNQSILKVVAFVAASALYLAGCSSKTGSSEPVEVNEYTSKSGMYSISLPGSWTEEDNMGMDDLMGLSRDDGMEAIVWGVGKEQMGQYGSDADSLEEFCAFAEKTFLNGAAASSEMKDDEAFTLAGTTSHIAKKGVMTQTGGAKGEVFLECAETELAYYLMMFSAPKNFDKKLDVIKANIALKELDVKSAASDVPETIRWFNGAYGILLTLNGGNINLVGGYEANDLMGETMKQVLERDWGVTSTAEADDMVEWLVTEGHNKEAMDYLTEWGTDSLSREELKQLMSEEGFASDEAAVMLAAYDAKAAYGENGISAWDKSRAMSILAYGYLAGYYTYEEAMDKSLEIGQQIQTAFGSWDDFMNSYFMGYTYWSAEDPENPSSQAAERKKLYEDLKEKTSSPYKLDWNLTLEKSW